MGKLAEKLYDTAPVSVWLLFTDKAVSFAVGAQGLADSLSDLHDEFGTDCDILIQEYRKVVG